MRLVTTLRHCQFGCDQSPHSVIPAALLSRNPVIFEISRNLQNATSDQSLIKPTFGLIEFSVALHISIHNSDAISRHTPSSRQHVIPAVLLSRDQEPGSSFFRLIKLSWTPASETVSASNTFRIFPHFPKGAAVGLSSPRRRGPMVCVNAEVFAAAFGGAGIASGAIGPLSPLRPLSPPG